jgi:hypothetical protein
MSKIIKVYEDLFFPRNVVCQISIHEMEKVHDVNEFKYEEARGLTFLELDSEIERHTLSNVPTRGAKLTTDTRAMSVTLKCAWSCGSANTTRRAKLKRL